MESGYREMGWRQVYREIMGSGLWSVQNPDTYFSWKGCDCPNCDERHKGADVYDCTGFRNLEDARNDRERYDFQLCAECMCRETNGEG